MTFKFRTDRIPEDPHGQQAPGMPKRATKLSYPEEGLGAPVAATWCILV